MRPPPRLLVVADDSVVTLPNYPAVAAGLLSLGPAVAILVATSDARLRADAERIRRLARPSAAALFVRGPAAVANDTGAQGLVTTLAVLPTARAEFLGWLGVETQPGQADLPPNVDFTIESLTESPEPPPPHRPIRFLTGGEQPSTAAAAKANGAFGMVVGGAWWSARDPVAACARWLATWDEA